MDNAGKPKGVKRAGRPTHLRLVHCADTTRPFMEHGITDGVPVRQFIHVPEHLAAPVVRPWWRRFMDWLYGARS